MEEWEKQIARRNVYKERDLGLKVRECYMCYRKIYWTTFMIGSHNKVQREHFTYEILKEIWGNPIFILQCCECFFSKK